MRTLNPDQLQVEGMAAIEQCDDFQFVLSGRKAVRAREIASYYKADQFIKQFKFWKSMYFQLLEFDINLVICYAFAKAECGYSCRIIEENKKIRFEFTKSKDSEL